MFTKEEISTLIKCSETIFEIYRKLQVSNYKNHGYEEHCLRVAWTSIDEVVDNNPF